MNIYSTFRTVNGEDNEKGVFNDCEKLHSKNYTPNPILLDSSVRLKGTCVWNKEGSYYMIIGGVNGG